MNWEVLTTRTANPDRTRARIAKIKLLSQQTTARDGKIIDEALDHYIGVLEAAKTAKKSEATA